MKSGSPAIHATLLAVVVLLLAGCMLRDLEEQVRLMDQACVIRGQVELATGSGDAIVVALTPGAVEEGRPPASVDFTVPDQAGAFGFVLVPGDYRLLAFEDLDGDFELDDDEPARHANEGEIIDCAAGASVTGQSVELDRTDRLSEAGQLTIRQGRNLVSSALESAVSLGQLTAFGEVVPLDDTRFDLQNARDSLWRPLDFIRAGRAGVYFGSAFDETRTPVLFIHGINGSPRVLEPMIEHIDGNRFQAMYFYYASGLRIDRIVWHLDQVMRELEQRHGLERYHVIAHSMGGLVARAWLLERSRQGGRARIASFVSLSTPWLGYPSARQGVEHSPVVVPVWRDMATGSDFLEQLFAVERQTEEHSGKLPPHHLLFSYRQGGWISSASGDGVAALASMLAPVVQRQAASIFGVDAGHIGIIGDETARTRVHSLLLDAEVADSKPDSD